MGGLVNGRMNGWKDGWMDGLPVMVMDGASVNAVLKLAVDLI